MRDLQAMPYALIRGAKRSFGRDNLRAGRLSAAAALKPRATGLLPGLTCGRGFEFPHGRNQPRGKLRRSRGDESILLELPLAVATEGRSIRLQNDAAGCFDNRLAGSAVPDHRRSEPQIEIGLGRSHQSEFQR